MKLHSKKHDRGSKIYYLEGPLFFASIESFKDIFTAKDDPESVIVNFQHSRVWDHSALEALERLEQRYKDLGKEIQYIQLSTDCARIFEKSGRNLSSDKIENPRYKLMSKECTL